MPTLSLYESVFRCSPVGNYLLSPTPDAVILAVNDAFLAASSRTREELVGLSLFDAFPGNPDDPADTGVAALRASIVRVIETGKTDALPLQRYPITVTLPDGSTRYEERFWNAVNTPIFGDDGRLLCISHTTMDVTAAKRAEDALRKSEERFRSLVTATSRMVWVAQPNGEIVESPSWSAFTGQTFDEWKGYGWLDVMHPDDGERLRTEFEQCFAEGRIYETESRVRHADGEYRWIAIRAVPVFNADGAIREWIGTNVDITVRKRAQEQVAQSAERLMLATDAAHLGVWVWDFTENEVTWENERLYEMFGVPKSAGPVTFARFVSEFLHPDDKEPYREMVTAALENDAPFRYEGRFYRQPDRALRWFEFTGLIHRDAGGAPLRIVGTAADITERKQAEQRLRHASLHDPLTGLPNRNMLVEVADRVLAHNRRVNRPAAVLYLDLDRFKPINDTHGHEFGDAVLKEVASRLSQSLRAEDVVVRVGGDEFVILLQEIDSPAMAGDVAAHIVALINEPFRVGALTLALSTSVGISIFPVDGEHIGALVTHADMAMYQAKQAGRNNLQFYSSEYAAEARLQAAIEQQLKSALRTDAFDLYYQPVVDIRSGRTVSVEALLRWRGVDIGPDRFVPVAEASGIINPIGTWVVREASRQHRLWRDHGLPAIPIAVNVSVVEFRAKDFAQRFVRLTREHGLDTGCLQLEVTETAIMDDIGHAAQVLGALRELGVSIALDDFGTGQSSLAYLARLPLDKLKIDKSFTSRIDSDLTSRAVTDAMIALGRTLNLEVVAEGVESEAVLDYLESRGCRQAQGYHFGKPMSGEALEAWYRERAARPARRERER